MLTISEYIRGYVGIEIPDVTLRAILYTRGLVGEADISSADNNTRALDLSIADVFKWALLSKVGGDRVEDADGDWKHSTTSGKIDGTIRKMWLQTANNIYRRYGEPALRASVGFKIHSL
jgi:hypothetical protein